MPTTAKTGNSPGPFARFTTAAANALGRPGVFILGVTMILVWAFSGPVLGFSDTWQLIINTATTLITFLMVFIIQNTQNRDSAAVHLKLDVIMAQLDVKDPGLYDAENRSEAELEAEAELITPSDPDAAPPAEATDEIFLSASDGFPDDLEKLSLAQLQVLHSRICRQLEHDYRTTPAGPPAVTLERFHDLVVELDHRHDPQTP